MSLAVLTRNQGEAIYAQIARLLREEITQRLKPGDCLPAEHLLAQRFGVNRHTVRRAVEDLIDEGLLERRHGRGTFVLDPPNDYLLGRGTRFTETFESLGKKTDSRVLRKLIVPARGGVAERLAIPSDSPVVWIETLRSADERPICVISHFLPQERVGAALANYHGGSLHEYLMKCFGWKLARSESLISACLPRGDDASLLAMPQQQPVLRVKSLNRRESDGIPIEYAVTRFRADRIQLRCLP